MHDLGFVLVIDAAEPLNLDQHLSGDQGPRGAGRMAQFHVVTKGDGLRDKDTVVGETVTCAHLVASNHSLDDLHPVHLPDHALRRTATQPTTDCRAPSLLRYVDMRLIAFTRRCRCSTSASISGSIRMGAARTFSASSAR